MQQLHDTGVVEAVTILEDVSHNSARTLFIVRHFQFLLMRAFFLSDAPVTPGEKATDDFAHVLELSSFNLGEESRETQRNLFVFNSSSVEFRTDVSIFNVQETMYMEDCSQIW